MDLVYLSKELDKEEFADLLYMLKEVNEMGRIQDLLEEWDRVFGDDPFMPPMQAFNQAYYLTIKEGKGIPTDWVLPVSRSWDNLSY